MIKIKKLTKLKELYIGGNNIVDITVLEDLKNLKTLNLMNNNISDISMLKNLINLEHLDISYNLITNIEVIINLDKLQKLLINDNLLAEKYYNNAKIPLYFGSINVLKNKLKFDRRKRIISKL